MAKIIIFFRCVYFLIVSASGKSLGDLLSGFVSGSASGLSPQEILSGFASGSASGLSPGLGSGFQNQDSGYPTDKGVLGRAAIGAYNIDDANGVAGNTIIKPKPSPFIPRPSYSPPRLTNSQPRPTNSPTRYRYNQPKRSYNQPKRSYSQPRPSNSQPNRIGSYKSTRNTISKSSSIIV